VNVRTIAPHAADDTLFCSMLFFAASLTEPLAAQSPILGFLEKVYTNASSHSLASH
jgi:hypothetical protein